MRKFVFALFLVSVFGAAWAQNIPAPGIKYNEGPAIGERYEKADTFLGCINAQTGTTYTIAATDYGCLVTFNNGGAIAVTVPAATTAVALKKFEVLNLGAGTATFTPTTSTVNGGASKAYTTGLGGTWTTDGTNYFAW
jgi:hypothetical protein